MHEAVYREFERICRARRAGGAVLEIGAVPSAASLLALPALAGAREKIGLDLDGPHRFADFRIERGDANRMAFPAARFDTILCNSVLEHDRCFWKTLAEIRRVARPGALVVLGVPAYVRTRPPFALRHLAWLPVVGGRIAAALASTPTLHIHNHPGDYYRFSPQAMREVLLEGPVEVEVRALLRPPRLVGAGVVPGPSG